MKPCTVDSVEMLKPSARILQMEDKSMKLRGLKKKTIRDCSLKQGPQRKNLHGLNRYLFHINKISKGSTSCPFQNSYFFGLLQKAMPQFNNFSFFTIKGIIAFYKIKHHLRNADYPKHRETTSWCQQVSSDSLSALEKHADFTEVKQALPQQPSPS